MRLFLTFMVSIFMISCTVVVQAAETDVLCPVSGKKAAKVSVSHNGGDIYFCCKNCRKAFEQNKDKFSTKANQQLVVTGQASQQKCPISGGKIKEGTELEVGGLPVSFCCKNCRKKVDGASGDAQLALVFGDEAFQKGYTATAKK